MALDPVSPRTPDHIGDIAVILTTTAVGGSAAKYEAQVLEADGTMFKHAHGNLVPHLSAGQITQLQAFMDDIRTKAQALLP